MSNPPIVRPIKVGALPWKEWSKGERFGSRIRRLSGADDRHVGVVMEELAPGKQSAPRHYHLLEEEHLFALAGTATLLLGDERLPLSAGDFVTFPAGQALAHAVLNEGSEPFSFLMIGENLKNEVCIYPDSDKILVNHADRIYRYSENLDYWDGEPFDAPASPAT